MSGKGCLFTFNFFSANGLFVLIIMCLLFQLRDLVNSLDAIKHYENSREFTEFGLLLKKFPIVKEIVRTLAIAYNATIELQRRDLSLSDAYGSWLKMELHLKNKQKRTSKTSLESKLLAALEQRKKHHKIFENPLMKAALYLDPRFRQQITRSQEDVNEAKEILLSVSRRLTALSEDKPTEDMNQSTESNNSSNDSFDAQKAFDQYLNRTVNVESVVHNDFELSLDLFDPPPMPIDASILNYWHTTYDKQDSKMLFDVAMVILAIPPTEVDIERDFSTLRFILSDLRTSLSAQTLENILTINLNRTLYLEINEKDVSELE